MAIYSEGITRALTGNRVWKSIFRFAYPATDKARAQIIHGIFFTHIHSIRVDVRSIRLTYTWGLGLVSFFLFVILTVTGILLMFFYVPFTDRAYLDMQALRTDISFGALMRNMHRWGAHLMVIFVFFHMMRVFYTGAYKRPREFNWFIGVLLLVLTLLLSFTGYLLPWDQLSFWAITVSTNIVGYAPFLGEKLRVIILGAEEVGQNALLRFYVLHCIVLPLAMALLISLHFWRIRKDGGLAASTGPAEREKAAAEAGDSPASAEAGSNPGPQPDPDPDAGAVAGTVQAAPPAVGKQTVFAWPNLMILEVIAGLSITAVLLIMSMMVEAPLRDWANPDVTENPSKAPWYFMNLQELLLHMHPALAGVIIPTLFLLVLAVIPYLDQDRRDTGIWFASSRGWQIALWTAVYTTFWICLLVYFDEEVGVRSIVSGPELLVGWVIPIGVAAVLILGFHLSLRLWRPDLRHYLIAYFTAIMVGYTVLTVIGTLFRGTGMHLTAPWDLPPGALSF
jgi:quinol-cytochrome oxidoreductase complex cytochrome b subunit